MSTLDIILYNYELETKCMMFSSHTTLADIIDIEVPISNKALTM
jgi:hypothetical protein